MTIFEADKCRTVTAAEVSSSKCGTHQACSSSIGCDKQILSTRKLRLSLSHVNLSNASMHGYINEKPFCTTAGWTGNMSEQNTAKNWTQLTHRSVVSQHCHLCPEHKVYFTNMTNMILIDIETGDSFFKQRITALFQMFKCKWEKYQLRCTSLDHMHMDQMWCSAVKTAS